MKVHVEKVDIFGWTNSKYSATTTTDSILLSLYNRTTIYRKTPPVTEELAHLVN